MVALPPATTNPTLAAIEAAVERTAPRDFDIVAPRFPAREAAE